MFARDPPLARHRPAERSRCWRPAGSTSARRRNARRPATAPVDATKLVVRSAIHLDRQTRRFDTLVACRYLAWRFGGIASNPRPRGYGPPRRWPSSQADRGACRHVFDDRHVPPRRGSQARGEVEVMPTAVRCENLNHRRSDAPVGHCPQCGAVVNARRHVEHCTEESHASARRQLSAFCAHCGVRLIRR